MSPVFLAAAVWLAMSGSALAEDAPICTDRPSKANGTCTVPEGRLQLETSAADWTRIEGREIRTDVWQVGGSFLKYGLTDHSDLQLGFTPYVRSETKVGGTKSDASGVGDVIIRYKHRLTPDGAPVQFGLIPFVKLPTAKHDIGDGKVEGGLATAINIPLGKTTLVFGPELDVLADVDGDGYHLQLVNLINLSTPLSPRLTIGGELWTATNFDPADTMTQFSADGAVAYLVDDEVQLDLGANLGLNDSTPDVEVYAGFSVRF